MSLFSAFKMVFDINQLPTKFLPFNSQSCVEVKVLDNSIAAEAFSNTKIEHYGLALLFFLFSCHKINWLWQLMGLISGIGQIGSTQNGLVLS